MKRSLVPTTLILAAFVLATMLAQPVRADDESDDVEIRIQAPLEAFDCLAVPPTIVVLGLTIDVSTAFADDAADSSDDESVESDEASEDSEESDSEDSSDDADDGGCVALVIGQQVEVKLASDVAPLLATTVKLDGDAADPIEIEAPLQSIDPVALTITVLGLTIDASAAAIEGADDQGSDDDEDSGSDEDSDDDEDSGSDEGDQPLDLTQLMVGQFVEVVLDATQLPNLVATEIVVKNFENEVDVEVQGPDGEEIDDEDDVTVDVTEKVRARKPGGRGKITRMLHFHTATTGSFVLSGLPTGSARITVTRAADGVTMRRSRSVRVKGNTSRSLLLKLRPVKP